MGCKNQIEKFSPEMVYTLGVHLFPPYDWTRTRRLPKNFKFKTIQNFSKFVIFSSDSVKSIFDGGVNIVEDRDCNHRLRKF